MSLKTGKLRNRDIYLNQLKAFQDKEFIKVVTGIRRCGKSSLLKLMADYLKDTGVTDEQIIEINFESMDYYHMDSVGIRNYVLERTIKDKKMYLFFDEVQRVPDWQIAINSLMVEIDCDIYVTGSNAFLLSSELSTYLSGRYVEIKVYPLSFREFLDFHGYELKIGKSPAGGKRYRIYDEEGEMYEPDEVLDAYLKFGGMPAIADVGLDVARVNAVLDGIYSAVVVRDIMERGRRQGERGVSDPALLRKMVMFLCSNIGSSTSARNIGNKLVSEDLLEGQRRDKPPAVQTVQTYVQALLESYVFYEIRRFDIVGKEYLSTLGKYYIVDLGLLSYLLGYRGMKDSGHKIENIVYFELLRRGYDVAVGKVGTREIDFIASKADEKIYYQVTDDAESEETMRRELSAFDDIKDNFEKVLIARKAKTMRTEKGIKIIKVTDFLLEEWQ